MKAYQAIRGVLEDLGFFRMEEALSDSKELTICWYAQQVDEVREASAALCDAVERYVAPKPGDEHCLRSELLNTKERLRKLLTK